MIPSSTPLDAADEAAIHRIEADIALNRNTFPAAPLWVEALV